MECAHRPNPRILVGLPYSSALATKLRGLAR